mgnify:CR=1 FL=1
MTQSLNIVAPDTSACEVTKLILRDGYAIIENIANKATDATRDEIGPQLEIAPHGDNNWLGSNTKRLGSVLKRSLAARDLVIHHAVIAIADQILLQYCARYQLNFSGVVHIEPGESAQTLHRDTLLYPFQHPYPTILLPTMWALTDFTTSNGATQIVPGSHLWEIDRQPFEDEIIQAEMPAGSVLIYLGGVWHGGGQNRSNTSRMGLAFQYSAGWLRQEENQYLANPPEVARDYPEALQRLIGYDFGGPFLGFVNGDDPRRILDNSNGQDTPSGGHRSRPDIDKAASCMTRLSLGDIQSVPTPKRDGVRVTTLQGFEEAG